MTNPSDPWSRRPEPEPGEGPTEQVAHPTEQVGYPSEVADPHGPAETISPTEYFAHQQGPEATRVLPPYDASWGGYESGGGYAPPTASYPQGYTPSGAAGYGQMPGNDSGLSYGPTGGPGGYQPGGFPQQPGLPQPPRKTGMWIGVGLAAFVLVALAGILAGVLLANKDSSDTTAAGTITHTGPALPGLPGNTSVSPLPSGIPEIPGLGDIDSLGANMGTLASNDGTTLTMTNLSGTTVTVHTDERTQVISLGSTKVADLPVGEMVMVQGDKSADGSIQAKLIISTSLPGGNR
ncbi:hypothetical protein GFY24_37975 [Nocardia sp. SYP-A9097]|uniref:DUF5666 domain-containing protein n=1 Tax=Nocardia sp. SYP-A9097 TaxID=2663237 RepID=UPI00129B80B3|nr:DUF5666 domain-containing protein [Nocardia sp. SYP-A9097]MRH93145.1 hypothetical protein [Nocardia sp. SYP-A9097]